MTGTVTELRRYPVKSMRGEQVSSCDMTEGGLVGDRAYAVVDGETAQVGSAKHPGRWGRLLQCEARYLEAPVLGQDLPPVSITFPDGGEARSDDPDVDAHLSALFDRAVHLTTLAPEGNTYLALWPNEEGVVPDEFRRDNAVTASAGGRVGLESGPDEADGTLTSLTLALASPPGTFFDVAPLHVVTRSTLRRLAELAPASEFGAERFRPNVVVDLPDDPFGENGWTGVTLRLGPAVAASVILPTMRCIMTTLAQGSLPRDPATLRTIARHNRIEIPGLGTWSCVGAYAVVMAAGAVRVGDAAAVEVPS